MMLNQLKKMTLLLLVLSASVSLAVEKQKATLVKTPTAPEKKTDKKKKVATPKAKPPEQKLVFFREKTVPKLDIEGNPVLNDEGIEITETVKVVDREVKNGAALSWLKRAREAMKVKNPAFEFGAGGALLAELEKKDPVGWPIFREKQEAQYKQIVKNYQAAQKMAEDYTAKSLGYDAETVTEMLGGHFASGFTLPATSKYRAVLMIYSGLEKNKKKQIKSMYPPFISTVPDPIKRSTIVLLYGIEYLPKKHDYRFVLLDKFQKTEDVKRPLTELEEDLILEQGLEGFGSPDIGPSKDVVPAKDVSG